MGRGNAEKKGQEPEASAQSPGKPYYKIGEVCEMTDTQPYVLRFWESEFPQLAPRKSRSGQRVYEKKDVELILKIKKLLYEDEYTIAGARKRLEEDGGAAPPQPAKTASQRKPDHPGKGPSEREKRLTSALKSLRRDLRAIKEMLES